MGNTESKLVQNHRYPSGNVYTGHLVGSKREGQGTLIWPDGARYEGHFSQDKLHGQGKLTFPNGSEYEGGFHQNNPQGNGRLTTRNGEMLTGFWQFHGRSDQTSSPCGKYHFNGQLVDLKTNWTQALNGPLALYLQSGLVALPNMADPMEAMLPYATAMPSNSYAPQEVAEKGGSVPPPVAAVVQNLPSSSDSISYGQREAAFQPRHRDDHGAVDVLDPRAWLNSVGVPVEPSNTNAQRQQQVRAEQNANNQQGQGPIATAIPVFKSL